MNRKKILLIFIIIIVSILVKQLYDLEKQNKNLLNSKPKINTNPSDIIYTTEYDEVEIEFLSDMIGFKEVTKFITKDLKIIDFIDSKANNEINSVKADDLNNNHTNKYKIKLSNDSSGYSFTLYYDTLYDKAYIEKDSDLFQIETNFARYIDSLLENTNINTNIDDAEALELFDRYNWTLTYKINSKRYKLGDIKSLDTFKAKDYYFAYNNELSKDIGLDLSMYSKDKDINVDVDIYQIYESMPEEFLPIKDARGIVVKNEGEIIAAFISSGRHSAFNACSLKGNTFDDVTGQTVDEWLNEIIVSSDIEKQLSKLSPEQIIEGYFTSLNKRDANAAINFISKKTMLGNITSNMSNKELFNENISLPLTDIDINDNNSFSNLKSAKLLDANLINQIDSKNIVFRVNVDLEYKKDFTINSGEQIWDCKMIYESLQTGWKIEEFGH